MGKGWQEMTIYTIGYGNDSPDKFLARLKAAGIDYVIDVRRANTKSWCGKYIPTKIRAWLDSVDIAYIQSSVFGNGFDCLSEYAEYLANVRYMQFAISWLVFDIRKLRYGERPCLLCSEKLAYMKTGEVNCHRVYLAAELAKKADCEVVHL